MDPFLLQLVIIPIIVIGVGVLTSVKVKRVWVAPVVTLIANLIIELVQSTTIYSSLHLTVYNVLFPALALLVSLFIIPNLREGSGT